MVMPETTIPSSVAFATLLLHIASPEKYEETVRGARNFLSKVIGWLTTHTASLRPTLLVANLTDFRRRRCALDDAGCIDGAMLWGDGNGFSQTVIGMWHKAADTRHSIM